MAQHSIGGDTRGKRQGQHRGPPSSHGQPRPGQVYRVHNSQPLPSVLQPEIESGANICLEMHFKARPHQELQSPVAWNFSRMQLGSSTVSDGNKTESLWECEQSATKCGFSSPARHPETEAEVRPGPVWLDRAAAALGVPWCSLASCLHCQLRHP